MIKWCTVMHNLTRFDSFDAFVAPSIFLNENNVLNLFEVKLGTYNL